MGYIVLKLEYPQTEKGSQVFDVFCVTSIVIGTPLLLFFVQRHFYLQVQAVPDRVRQPHDIFWNIMAAQFRLRSGRKLPCAIDERFRFVYASIVENINKALALGFLALFWGFAFWLKLLGDEPSWPVQILLLAWVPCVLVAMKLVVLPKYFPAPDLTGILGPAPDSAQIHENLKN